MKGFFDLIRIYWLLCTTENTTIANVDFHLKTKQEKYWGKY